MEKRFRKEVTIQAFYTPSIIINAFASKSYDYFFVKFKETSLEIKCDLAEYERDEFEKYLFISGLTYVRTERNYKTFQGANWYYRYDFFTIFIGSLKKFERFLETFSRYRKKHATVRYQYPNKIKDFFRVINGVQHDKHRKRKSNFTFKS